MDKFDLLQFLNLVVLVFLFISGMYKIFDAYCPHKEGEKKTSENAKMPKKVSVSSNATKNDVIEEEKETTYEAQDDGKNTKEELLDPDSKATIVSNETQNANLDENDESNIISVKKPTNASISEPTLETIMKEEQKKVVGGENNFTPQQEEDWLKDIDSFQP